MQITIDARSINHQCSAMLQFEDDGNKIIVEVMESVGKSSGLYTHLSINKLEWARLLEAGRAFLIEKVEESDA